MSEPHTPPRVEPERYEFAEEPAYRFELNRRRFLESLGAGIVVLVVFRDGALAQPFPSDDPAAADPIAAWLFIAEDGTVTVYTGKVEVGQDIRTSLTQAVADELHVTPASIHMVMGDTDLTPFDMGTFGSRTTPTMAPQLRRAAAAARSVLLELAAQRWGVPAARLTVADGKVSDGSGHSAGIGELTGGQRLVQTIADDLAITPPDRWTVAGASLPRVAGPDIVTGRHRYPSDHRLPGMLVGKVLRAPAFGVQLLSLDTSAAAALPDVVVVHDGDFAGVAAPDSMAAERALAALRPQWSAAPAQPSHRTVYDHLRHTATTRGQGGGRGREGWGRAARDEQGSMEQGLAAAAERLEATYTAAYIAHVPLEPRAALAHWEDGKLTVWTGTQRPFAVRTELTRAFHLSEDKVRVLMPDTGSGYGGKHTGEVALEAARLAHAAGKPVHVRWTREEEFTWAYFRPAAVIDVKSGVRRDGTLTAWEFHNYNSGAAAIGTSYEVPNRRIVYHPADSPLRQGSYRGLAATANTFARESHMDELADRIGMDPLAFRLHNLRDQRLRAVLQAAAERFHWQDWQPTPGHGIGIAANYEKGGYVATCAEVVVDGSSGHVGIARIVEAFECGAIVNPDGLHNQVEGAILMGIGGALWEAIEFENGRILNGRLSQYRVPRLSDLPPLEVVLLNRPDIPSAGAGETPMIALAPALGNAIFRATGTRLRALPLVPNGLG